jgi:hypothetical protein
MKVRGENTVYALALLMIVYLLLSTCMAYAAPAAAQKGTQQMQPATGAAASVLNPNAPPQGSITITSFSPPLGPAHEWVDGDRREIQWTCHGTKSNLVDVQLWCNGRLFEVIATGVASGHTFYRPNPAGQSSIDCDLRVISEDDNRIMDKQPVQLVMRDFQTIMVTISGSVTTATGTKVPSYVDFTVVPGAIWNPQAWSGDTNYIIYNIPCLAAKVTITPSADGYTFSPPSRTITMNCTSVTGQNFIALPVQLH